MKKRFSILFFSCQWPDSGSKVDIVFVPSYWSYKRIRNRFAKRNPKWNFKKKEPMIALFIDKTYISSHEKGNH